MEIVTTNDKATVVGNVVEYKEPLRKGSNSTVNLEFIYPQDKKITDFLVTPTCGCTVSTTFHENNKSKVNLVYDTHRIGTFDKTVRISYKEDGRRVETTIRYKGEVLNQK